MPGSAPKCFAFVFPMASGHINPSLPVARSLVEAGHEVHYLCRPQMREAIEDTGATFHSDVEHEPELYEGREVDLLGALKSLKQEYGLENENFADSAFRFKMPMIEMMLPGVIRWLRSLHPCAVAYCPVMNEEAGFAAQFLGIPSVALLTLAGAGSVPAAFREFLASSNSSEESIRCVLEAYEPSRGAIDRLNKEYGLTLSYTPNLKPLGRLDVLKHSVTTLVTTSEILQDPMSAEIAEAYAQEGVRFEAVGPLLDKEGAKRAAGHKFEDSHADGKTAPEAGHGDGDTAGLLRQVQAARTAGRPVVLVSMGTVITGDSTLGWEGRVVGADGKERGLTGRELCRAAWGAAFDALGSGSTEEGPLLVVSLGPQPEALGDLVPPANAVCLPVLPQVDILRAGVAAFLTHGGQNSFMEGLVTAAPLVVCPGFGDQPVNARKAEAFGVGLQVPRPDPEEGDEAAAAAQYRSDVATALLRVMSETAFSEAAAGCAEQLRQEGGVPRAVEIMLAAAASGVTTQSSALSKREEALATGFAAAKPGQGGA